MSESQSVPSCNLDSSDDATKTMKSNNHTTSTTEDKHVKKKVSLSLDTVDESPPSSPRPPSKPRERRGAVDSMKKSGSTHSCHLSE